MSRSIVTSEYVLKPFVRQDVQALAAGMAAMQAAASDASTLQHAGSGLLNDHIMPQLADQQGKRPMQLGVRPAAVPSLLGSALPSPSYAGLPSATPTGRLAGLCALTCGA